MDYTRRELEAGHVAMTAIYTWLLKMTGGDETRASIVAVSIALIDAVVLGVGLYFALGSLPDAPSLDQGSMPTLQTAKPDRVLVRRERRRMLRVVMDIRMTRLTRVQIALLKFLITGLIAADLFAIWVWATRPPRIYSVLLGLTDSRLEAPFFRVANWAGWNDGPRTPSGFVVLFDPGELVFCGVLLLALVLLILFLFAPHRPTPRCGADCPRASARCDSGCALHSP